MKEVDCDIASRSPLISLKHVCKRFGAQAVLNDVSFDVEAGETLALVGSSGSGKTTALKMINALENPTSGIVEVRGRRVSEQDPIQLRRSIGYVIQKIGLFPHLSVERNVEMVPRILGWPHEKRRRRAHEMLELVGLDAKLFAHRLPSQLSGGQQQRVGVARALAADPDCLLMDEPFGALDAVTRGTLQQEMLRLKRQLRKTIVLVTHDIEEAALLADRVGVLHDGELVQLGTLEELARAPAGPFVRQLLARFNRPDRCLAEDVS